MATGLDDLLLLLADGPMKVQSASLEVRDWWLDRASDPREINGERADAAVPDREVVSPARREDGSTRRIWFRRPGCLRVENWEGAQLGGWALARERCWWAWDPSRGTIWSPDLLSQPPLLCVTLLDPATIMRDLLLDVEGSGVRLGREVVRVVGWPRRNAGGLRNICHCFDVDVLTGSLLWRSVHCGGECVQSTEVLFAEFDRDIDPRLFTASWQSHVSRAARTSQSGVRGDEKSTRRGRGRTQGHQRRVTVRSREAARPTRVLRPRTRRARNVTAQVFEARFGPLLVPDIDVTAVDGAEWLDAILGPGGACGRAQASAFADAVAAYDFLCPDYNVAVLLPYLALLRNRSRSKVRLLIIAHSPGVWPVELALLRDLLRPGDRIIAPSRSAEGLICALLPALASFVRVVPHAQPAFPASRWRVPERRAVSLVRLCPQKLIHRQIEALSILRARGLPPIQMDLAGEIGPSRGKLYPYVASLVGGIRRAKLADTVRFVGLVRGDAAKAEFLRGACMVVNLSVALEESFGQSVTEALSDGIPVVTTNWDGLPETVGRGGVCIETRHCDGMRDVAPDLIADAVEEMLSDAPTPAVCRAEAARFEPSRVRSELARELHLALEEEPGSKSCTGWCREAEAAGSGVLDMTAPLTVMSTEELRELYLAAVGLIRRRLGGCTTIRHDFDEIRDLVRAGVRPCVEHQLAGLGQPQLPSGPGFGPVGMQWSRSLRDIVTAATTSLGTTSSRVACLRFLAAHGGSDELEPGLDVLSRETLDGPELPFLEARARRNAGDIEGAVAVLSRHRASFMRRDGMLYLTELARAARQLRRGELALPALQAWVARYPDAPDIGTAWLEIAATLWAGRQAIDEDVHTALLSGLELLGIFHSAGADSQRYRWS